MLRALPFFAIALAVFGTLNFVGIRALLRIHPRGRRVTLAVAVLTNVMWLFLPIIGARTPLSRFTRAFFGPPWFGWLVFLLLYCAFLLLVAIAWLPFHRRFTFRVFARRPSLLFLAAIGVACAVGYYDAIVPLRVERVPVAIRDLPPEAVGMKIAVMADLHVGLFTRPSRLEQFFGTVSALHPDVLVLDGDLIDDDPVYVPKLLRSTAALDRAIPLLGVLGNHEIYGDPIEALADLRGSRIRMLVNQGLAMRGIWLAGISDYAAVPRNNRAGLVPDLAKALEGRPAGAIPIVLAHQPKVFDEARLRAIPLSIVAHTHGGQCGIRALRWSVAGLFLPYHMGLYRVGASQLYVNTGTGYWLLPFRLGMTPEITLIELRNE